MQTSLFDYNLPKELIAINPPEVRGSTRLLVIDREGEQISHQKYENFINYVEQGDLVVLNKTKVIKARVYGTVNRNKKQIECLFLKDLGNNQWEALIGYASNVRPNDEILVAGADKPMIKIHSRIESKSTPGYIVEILHKDQAHFFEQYGNVPLPAYIKRETNPDDEIRYNTVFAQSPKSVASPTASLNLTDELLAKVRDKGASIAFIDLQVGWGTFAPIRPDTIEEFKIHTEHIELDQETADLINQTKERGGNIWAFGTTVARTLESCAIQEKGAYRVRPYSGDTDIFIIPGYEWKIIDRLLTNFHAPRTSLIALVSSFGGHELIMEGYQEAIDQKYSFLSYGDSMLIM